MIKNILDEKNNNKKRKNVSKSLNYISPNIPIRVKKGVKKESELIPKKINIYENMDLERQKKFFLQNINYNNDYNKIYKEFHNEMINLANNRKNNVLILNNDSNQFNFITSYKYKGNTLNTNENKNNKTLDNNSRNQRKEHSLEEINDRLYYKQIWKPLEIEELKRHKKLTEYVAYNKARNRVFEKKLRDLYED